VVTAAVTLLAPVPGEAVGDVGFGGGLSLDLLLGLVGPTGSVHGIEISDVALRTARRRFRREVSAGRLELHEAGVADLPLPEGSLDGLMTVNTIYFVDDLVGAFRAMRGALAPAGRLVLGIGDPAGMADMPVTGQGFRLRPVPEVQDALAEAGLTEAAHQRVGEGPRGFHLLLARPGG
jgi:arsenite methyltransferase